MIHIVESKTKSYTTSFSLTYTGLRTRGYNTLFVEAVTLIHGIFSMVDLVDRYLTCRHDRNVIQRMIEAFLQSPFFLVIGNSHFRFGVLALFGVDTGERCTQQFLLLPLRNSGFFSLLGHSLSGLRVAYPIFFLNS